MSVYKDEKTGKWYALAWYHDWKGEGRQKCKRGFETKKVRISSVERVDISVCV